MSPPTVPRKWKIGVGVVYAFIVLYSLIVVQQLLLGIIVPAIFISLVYFAWRILRVLEMQYDGGSEDEEEPLERLKRRYAAGEISEAEFERKVEQLLQVDDLNRSDPLSNREVNQEGEPVEYESEKER